jgi:hypothetical protein
MSVTRAQIPERERYLAEIDKVINSQVLHGSESLCKLLRYLVVHALDHPGSSLKEYQIATEVFGRPHDFDPQHDSTIRVQAGRLRLKLAEYYATEGAQDTLVVEMPKGTYVVSFHNRAALPAKPRLASSRDVSPTNLTEAEAAHRWPMATIIPSILLALAVVIIALFLAEDIRHRTQRANGAEQAAPAALSEFWKAYITGQEEPWVIFSNGAFVGRPETGMRYFDSSHDSRDVILDHYTGVGEVLAIHALDRTFGELHRQLRVKRGSLLSIDDVKNNDMIFVGSPAENLTLREIPNSQEFVFRRLESGPRKGDLSIANIHPQPGEAMSWLGSPSHSALTEDYSVIALVRGLNPAKSVLILAGITTIGTQAAVEFVCQQNSLEELLPRLKFSSTGEVEPFEAVLRVKVTRGVPVESEIVALRSRNP